MGCDARGADNLGQLRLRHPVQPPHPPPHGRHRPSQGTQTTWGNSRKEQMANCEHGHTHDIGGQWSDRAWAPRAGLRDFKQRTRPPMVNGVSAQELREETHAAYSVILAKL